MNTELAALADVMPFIHAYERFAVFTHISPDGDALGSSFALCSLLRSMGKQAVTVLIDPVPWKYDLPEFRDLYVMLADADFSDTQACIAVDCATLARLGKGSEQFNSLPTLSIDHHESNERFARNNYVEESPATAQIIYELFRAAEQPVSLDAAAAIYMGIIADTGNLSYPCTTAHTFEICAELARSGLDTSAIAERVFYTRSVQSTKLIGVFIRNLHLYAEDRIAISHLSGAALANLGASSSDTEELINYARDIVTVEVAVFLRQVARDRYKASIRSKGALNVSDFAAQFGGGGHSRAAGCMLEGGWESIEQDLAKRLSELLV